MSSTVGSISGIPASPGRAAGPIHVVEDKPTAIRDGIDMEAIREAADRAASRLEALGARVAGTGAAVLEAQALMLRDTTLLAAVAESMARGESVAAAVAAAVETYARELEGMADPYLRERAGDVRELGRLLLAELSGASPSRLADVPRPSVVFARELAPADTLGADRAMLLALVTEAGGRTSHAAIVARELGIPAVVGAQGALAAARQAAFAEVDGDRGELRFDTAAEAVTVSAGTRLAVPLSDVFVPILCNAGSLNAVQAAAEQGARGVGLFRTEFLYLERRTAPTEAEQIETYAAACEAIAPHPVIVRTLDAGSDKALPYLSGEGEPNPALGCRGVRLWLRHRDLSEPQCRALVAVSRSWPNLWVMAPMVATRDEMATVREIFTAEALRLGTSPPRLGMMVEVPAAAMALEQFQGLVDFFSIGTNDLTQYALAADRELDAGPGLTEFNPGVLRLIARAIRTAGRLETKIGVCGEMAGSPEGAVFLAGAGADTLSMTSTCMAPVGEVLARLGPEGCRRAAQSALAAADAGAALACLRAALR